MTVLNWSNKDPDDDLPFMFDWDDHLPEGDTISMSSWLVPAGLTMHGPAVDGRKTLVWLDGGEPNAVYLITCQVTAAPSGWKTSQTGRIRISDTQ